MKKTSRQTDPKIKPLVNKLKQKDFNSKSVESNLFVNTRRESHAQSSEGMCKEHLTVTQSALAEPLAENYQAASFVSQSPTNARQKEGLIKRKATGLH